MGEDTSIFACEVRVFHLSEVEEDLCEADGGESVGVGAEAQAGGEWVGGAALE